MKLKSTAQPQPRRFKWMVRAAVALFIYTVVGFFVLPPIIKSQMLKRLPGLTHRQAAVRQVKANPYMLSLTVRGFSLKEPNGEDFAAFDEFYVNFQLVSLFKRAWVFKEISLQKPFGQITYREDGTFNFANLLNSTNAAPPPRILIAHLSITNGAVAFADLKRKIPFRTQFTPIDVRLTHFTTQPEKDNPYSFTASDDAGEMFSWSGNFSINPLRSSGSFKVGALQIKKYSPYLQDFARFEVQDGKVDVQADYRFDFMTNGLSLQVSKADVELRDLQLQAPDTGETVVSIPALSVQQAEADLLQRTAKVGAVKSSGGSILVRQNQDGTINLLALLNLPGKDLTLSKSPAEAASQPWKATIDEIAFEQYAVKVEDRKPAKPASLNVDQIAMKLKSVSNLTNAPLSAAVSLRFQETGTVAIGGTATLFPPSADLDLAVTNLDLRAFQPYVEEQLKLAITSGALQTQGHARYGAGTNEPLVHFTGNFSITNFATIDDVLRKDFAKWDAMTVDGIQLDLQPNKLQLEQVKFAGLKTSLIVGPDHRSNLETILRSQAWLQTNEPNVSAVQTHTIQRSPLGDFNIALAALVVENASILFSDQSLQPSCTFSVQEFGGSIKGLSSQEQTTATVDLSGKVDAQSPFSVTGKINPLSQDLFVDLAVSLKNTELTSFTPYAEKFAGYPLQKGKLSFDVHYSVAKKELKGENNFHLDHFTLGAKNNSPDATHLPVKLAIALLKDRNGKIALNLPVAGRIDDPKFNLSGVILQVFMNVLTKAVTSPFALLGAMFGGGEELSFVQFEPGISDLAESESKKLDTLAKALFERPALNLEITGSIDPVNEREALARLRLEQQIKLLRIKELAADGKPTVAANELKLEPKDHDQLLKQIYRETFGRYKPTPPKTDPTLSGTNAPKPLAFSQPMETQKGAALLMTPVGQDKSNFKSSGNAAPGQPVRTRAQTELTDMEDQLIAKITITDSDLRNLMQERASKVQDYLLKTGKVTVERLFILTPKTIDAAFKGEARANLSLN